MAFQDYSTNPDANTSIGGINIAEGCPAGNMNEALRRLAADGKLLANTVGALGGFMPITGGVFQGEITRQSRGAYRHNNAPALTDAQDFFLPEGSSLPAGAEGRVVYFYSAS